MELRSNNRAICGVMLSVMSGDIGSGYESAMPRPVTLLLLKTAVCSPFAPSLQNLKDSDPYLCFREERNQTQVLRQQQDEAYLASLRADQEKERKKREEMEQRKQEEEKVRQSALAEERRLRVSYDLFLRTRFGTTLHVYGPFSIAAPYFLQTLEEEKERKSECLPPEPPADDPESVKIVFKLPNDTRVERRFLFGQSLTVSNVFTVTLILHLLSVWFWFHKEKQTCSTKCLIC